jgi:hypothetical protein
MSEMDIYQLSSSSPYPPPLPIAAARHQTLFIANPIVFHPAGKKPVVISAYSLQKGGGI